MNIPMVHPLGPARRERVIALHCSGADGGQWRHFADALGDCYELLTPEHYGCETSGPWTGEHAFTIADEAARTIDLIDMSKQKVHLVGHSYGGGVALHVALARPSQIASMALYEPSAFHLLRQIGDPGAKAYAEIKGVARRIGEGVVAGNYRGAVADFVDYWNGPGSWSVMRPAIQQALICWAPKGPLDFRALIDDTTSVHAYRELDFPVLIMRGEHGPMPNRVIAQVLSTLLPTNRLMMIGNAGHMGPLTHAPEVSALIVRHVADAKVDA